MESRLTRAEYWILETAVEMPIPLCFLNPDRYEEDNGIELMFNKPGHGLSLSRLIETLVALFRAQLIEACADETGWAINPEQIEVALKGKGPIHISEGAAQFDPSCMYYRLTPGGGALWEKFAAANWEQYVKTEVDESAQTITLTSTSPSRIHTLLEHIKLVLYDIDNAFGYSEFLDCWEATYWKVLPKGYRTCLRWRKELPLEPSDTLRQLAFTGYCQARDGWYGWR